MLVTTDLVFDFGLKLNFTESLALAGVLSMTSLGIVAKVLTDGGYLNSRVGLQIFTVVIIAELIALLLIGFSIGEHAHQVSPLGILILLGKVAGFSVVTWVLSSRVLPPLVARLQRVIQVPQLSLGLLLGLLFLTVYGAELVGLHGSLGALLFGASLSGFPTRYSGRSSRGFAAWPRGLRAPLLRLRRTELQLYLRNLAAGSHGGVGADPIARQLHRRFHRSLRVPPRRSLRRGHRADG